MNDEQKEAFSKVVKERTAKDFKDDDEGFIEPAPETPEEPFTIQDDSVGDVHFPLTPTATTPTSTDTSTPTSTDTSTDIDTDTTTPADEVVGDEKVVPAPETNNKDLIGLAVELGFDEGYAGRLAKAGLLSDGLKEHIKKNPNLGKPEENEDEPKKFEHGLTTENYDEDIVKTMDRMTDIINEQNGNTADLEKRLAEVTQEMSDRRTRQDQGADEAKFDVALSSLDGEYSDIFGSGKTIDLPDDSKEFKNREAVWKELTLANLVRQAQELEPLPIEQGLRRALAYVFPENPKIRARKEIASEVVKRSESISMRPAGSPVDLDGAGTGQEKAVNRVTEYLDDKS